MRTLLVAIHGIMTNQTNASWPDKLDAWMFDRDPEIKVLKKEYRAGPFPRWNCRVKDPRIALVGGPRVSTAYTIGYMKALLRRANEEAEQG